MTYDLPEDVQKFDRGVDRLEKLLRDFCENQGLPYQLLAGVPDKLRECRLGDLTVEEVSPVADALEHRKHFGHGGPDDELDWFKAYFASTRDIMLAKEIREHHLGLMKTIEKAAGPKPSLN